MRSASRFLVAAFVAGLVPAAALGETPKSGMKGWKILPTHFANQDLADIWLDQ